MIANKSVIAIIPARGGSKGVPGKNVKDLCGKPLIVWTIEAALKSSYIDTVLVTSDDDDILKISEAAGAQIIKRPSHLATDESPSIDAVLHALDTTAKHNVVILLQPTSPLRNEKHIDEALELFLEKSFEPVVSVCEVTESPYWMYKFQGGLLCPLLEDARATRRQDLPKVYKLNGAIYIKEIESLLEQRNFLQGDIVPYFMNKAVSTDIDCESDFITISVLMKHRS